MMDSEVSPNGEYAAYAYEFYQSYYQTIEIRDKEGKLIWQIPYQGELPQGDPHPRMGIYRWVSDSSQLYFCYYWSPDGGDVIIRYSCRWLQTIDIQTGEIQTVVPDGYTAFEFSNDGSHIAYLQCNDTCIMHIQNLTTGTEKTTRVITNPKDFAAIGDITWSPGDTGLFFDTQATDYITMQTIYVDTSTMKVKVIKAYPGLISSGDWVVSGGWADDNTLIFLLGKGSSVIQVVHFNVRDNESTVIGTPTPSN